jgi:hypothetical protein
MPEVTPAAAPAAPAAAPQKPAESAAKPGEQPKAEGAAAPKMHKVKVDGKEIDVPEEDLHKHYGTFAAGQKALKEAAETKKAADAKVSSLVQALKSADYKALTEAGLGEDEIEKLSVQFLSARQQARLEEERIKGLDPKERELEELRREKAEREKKEEESKKTQHEQDVEAIEQRLAGSVIDTLEKFHESYRRNDFVAQRVLEAWAYFEENKDDLAKKGFDIAQVTPDYIAGKVRAELRALSRQMAEAAGEDELDEFVPDSLAGRVLQRRQAKAQKEAHPALTQNPQVRDLKERKEEKKAAPTTAQVMRRSYFPKQAS